MTINLPATAMAARPTQRAPVLRDELLNETEVAREFEVTVRCVRNWRQRGAGPAYIKIGRLVRYQRSAIEAYKRERTVYPSKAGAGDE